MSGLYILITGLTRLDQAGPGWTLQAAGMPGLNTGVNILYEEVLWHNTGRSDIVQFVPQINDGQE